MGRDGPGTSGTFDAPASPNHEHAFPATAFERLRLTLDAGAIIGIWVWDILENRLKADEHFSRAFGLPAERCMAGIPIDEVFSSTHPDDRDRVSADIQVAMNRGGAYRREAMVRQEDGSYRWIEANDRAELNSRGQAVRFPGILMDIESRRSAEAKRDRMSAFS